MRIQTAIVVPVSIEEQITTSPPMETVASSPSVPNFVITRKGYGTITYKSPVDLSDIPTLSALKEVIQIERGLISLYKKSTMPSPGNGINVPAEILLEGIRPPPDFEPEEFQEELQNKENTQFISYDAETGNYMYTVEHF